MAKIALRRDTEGEADIIHAKSLHSEIAAIYAGYSLVPD